MKSIYLANGLFSLGDRLVNEMIAKKLRDTEKYEVYVPQENDEINDKSNFATSRMIATADLKELDKSDIVIAVIDGVEIDSGTAAEIGYAFAKGKTIIGVCTDIRLNQEEKIPEEKIKALEIDGAESQFLYRNLFVIGLIKQSGGFIVTDINNLEKSLYILSLF